MKNHGTTAPAGASKQSKPTTDAEHTRAFLVLLHGDGPDPKVPCAPCKGEGVVPVKIACPDCHGEGERFCNLGHEHPCEDCKGTGKVERDDTCPDCQGAREVPAPLHPADPWTVAALEGPPHGCA